MNSKPEALYLGIEIGGTKLQIIIGDGNAVIRDRIRETIDPSKGASKIKDQIERVIQKLLPGNNVRAIGVGFGGPVNWKTGAIQLSHQIEGWGNFNLKIWLEEITGLPVAIDNDANTAALAEAKQGAGKGHNVVFYMTIGSGIGGGMIIDNKIYHGRTPGEVEIGHIRINKSGTTLENVCSGWAVNKKVRQHIEMHPEGVLARLAEKKAVPEAFFLTPALEQSDSPAIQIIQDIADDISFALSHVTHLFNPDIIILGGGLSLLGDYLRIPISERLANYIMKALLPAPPIKIAALGEDVVPIGALELAKAASIFEGEIK